MKEQIKRDFIRNIYCDHHSLLPFLPVFRDKISTFSITDDDDITRTGCIRFSRNGSYSIILNKKFIAKFDLDSKDIMWMIIHEISHYLLGHFDYPGTRNPLENFVFDTQVNSLMYNINSRKSIGLLTKIYRRFYKQLKYKPEKSALMNVLLVPPFKKRELIEKELNEIGLLSEENTGEFVSLWYDLYSRKGLSVQVIYSRLSLIFDVKRMKNYYFILIQSEGRFNEELRKKIATKYIDKISNYLGWFRKSDYFEHEIIPDPLTKKDIKELNLLKHAITQTLSDSKDHSIETEKEMFFNSVIPFYARKQITLITGGYYPLFFPGRFFSRDIENRFSAVYIDFSGSTRDYKDKIYFLLQELKDFFKGPYFLFSTRVKEVSLDDIKKGHAISGGTNIDAVLMHINENKFKKALIITDGLFDSPRIEINAEIYEILLKRYETIGREYSKLKSTGKLKKSWFLYKESGINLNPVNNLLGMSLVNE